MNKEIINKMADLWSQVTEKNLDPVNKDAVKKKFDDRKDKDIDNDGDTDSTDKYLHKRRKAISKAVTNEDKDKMDKCPDCEGSMENHDPDCPRAEKGDKKKIEDDRRREEGRGEVGRRNNNNNNRKNEGSTLLYISQKK